MKVIEVNNVTEALPEGYQFLALHGVREETRNGPAYVSPVPVATVYRNPLQRVMFAKVRDANPFFHLMEGLWMLLGRGDAAFLGRFIPSFGAHFAEPDGNIHGAYGRRWRNHFVNVQAATDINHAMSYKSEPDYIDQLDIIINELVRDPTSRQAVLAMWDPEVDLGVKGLKDRPCNTHVYFRVRTLDTRNGDTGEGGVSRTLDITVCCRSNDMVLGAYGANAVHFSMLQEFIAAQIGAGVGTYTQVSNNFHMYKHEVDRLEKRLGEDQSLSLELRDTRYADGIMVHYPMVRHASSFIPELRDLIGRYERGRPLNIPYNNTFLSRVVAPMLYAHTFWRTSQLAQAYAAATSVEADDWRVAALEWLARRKQS